MSASAPAPKISSFLPNPRDWAAGFAGAGDDLAFRSTTGDTVDCLVVETTDVVAAGAADAGVRTVAVRVVTLRVATAAGLATEARVVLVTVRVRTCLAGVSAVVDCGAVTLVSLVAGVSVVVTGEASIGGGGLDVDTGAGSVGCVC